MRIYLLLATTAILLARTTSDKMTEQEPSQDDESEQENDTSRKVIGSRVVTSVSVVLNGHEPQFSDAVGKPVPRPQVPPQVASPINLLNPDRYEFYTFNDSGELVKRLMTMKEIQSIVAGGEADSTMLMQNSPLSNFHHEPQANINDIVTNVQNVLQKEMAAKKNYSGNAPNKLDTPDTSVSWSHILPAIFGNTGDQIVPDKSHVVGMTPESVLYEQTEKTTVGNKPLFERPTTTNKPKQKPSATQKPVLKTSVKPVTTTKFKNSEKKKPAKINNTEAPPTELPMEFKEVSGSNYYVPPTTIPPFISNPTKYVIIRKRPLTTTEEPDTTGTLDDIIQTMSTITQNRIDSSSTASPSSSTSSSTRKPSKASTTASSTRAPTTIFYSSIKTTFKNDPTRVTFGTPTKAEALTAYSSSLSSSTSSSSTAGSTVSSSTSKYSSSSPSISSSSPVSSSSIPSVPSVPPMSYTFKSSASSTPKITTTSRKPSSTHGTTLTTKQEPGRTTEYPTTNWFMTTDSTEADATEFDSTESISTEHPSIFDSHYSLNQIIESLKDEATTTQNGIVLDDNMKNYFETTTLDEASGDTSTFSDDLIYTTMKVNKPYVPSMGHIPNLHQIFKDNAAFIADRNPPKDELSSTLFDAELKQTDQSIPIEDNTPSYTLMKQPDPVTEQQFPENHKVVQEVDNFIQNNAESIADSMTVETANMDHKIPKIEIPVNLTMSEFAEQAATVASILSNENTERSEELHLRESFDNVISQIQDEMRTTTDLFEAEATTFYPTLIHNVEALPLVNDSATNDNKIETSVVMKTSSISSSSSVSEKPLYVATPAGVMVTTMSEEKRPAASKKKESHGDDISNFVKVPLLKDAYDRNTEISVQADVHETINTVKVKKTTTVPPPSEQLTTKGPAFQDEVTATTSGYIEIETLNPTTQGFKERTTTGVSDTTTDLPGSGSTEYTTEVSESSGSGEFTELYSDDTSYATDDSSSETVSIIQSDDLSDSSESSFYGASLEDDDEAVYEKVSKNVEEQTESRIASTTNEASEYQTTPSKIRETTEFEQDATTNQSTERDDDEVRTTFMNEFTTESDMQNDQNVVSTTEDTATTLMNEMEQKWELLTKNKDSVVPQKGPELIKTVLIAASPTEPPRKEYEEITLVSDKRNSTTSSITRKEDSQEIEEDQKAAESQTYHVENEDHFANLGESSETGTKRPDVTTTYSSDVTKPSKVDGKPTQPDKINKLTLQKLQQKLQSAEQKIYHISQTKPSIKLPPALSTLKLKVGGPSTKKPVAVKLDPAPKQALGLEESTVHANEDILEFTKMCNELAFAFWRALNSEGVSSARSLILSPFALNSMLSMVFLGARGGTSGEMNEMLRLDDMVTFNPHVIFHNISESAENTKESQVATSAFVRELFSDRSKGKILPFYKEKAQQFYSGHVEEVNYNIINDIIRRRTNLLVKRHTNGKIIEYLKTNNVWTNMPLSGISANIFQTDCSKASTVDRDGEMFFQVLPAIRQRRLVPIPAAVWQTGFTAGYDPELDATAVAFGSSTNTVSTIFVMPGQQGHSAPGDNLERLESVLMINAVSKNAWRRLLTTLMERPGLEVQIPRFSHRSFINATASLQKMGLKTIFDFDKADLRGLTGSTTRDMFISDMVQINTFSTCGEDKIADQHHVEMYPAPPIKTRSINNDDFMEEYTPEDTDDAVDAAESQRAFHDPLLDLKYLELPLPLRPRQARIPEAPRLRFDKPFLYFVRHNPTGMLLYMGRFNPRLLP